VVTLAVGLESIGGLVAGRLSDRHGRRDVLVVFLSCSALLLVGAGLAPAHLAAMIAIVASGFFVGAMRPVLSALVADMSSPQTRRAAFSLSYLGINLGVAVGPLMAGWFFNHALRWLFWIDGISTAAALIILVWNVPRHTNPTDTVSVEQGRHEARGSLSSFIHNPVLFPFAVFGLLYNVVYAQLVFTLGLQLINLFGNRGPQIYGLVWALNAITVIGLTPLALRATRQWSNLRSIAFGMGFFTLGIGVFLLEPGLGLVLVSTVLWTAGEVLFSIHVGDLVSTFSPPELRGRFQGYVQFFVTLGFVVSPVAGGLVAQALGLAGVWWLATALVAAAGIGFALLNRRTSAAT
jgi:MFS family permease